ncbi:MAG: riboflavin synthase [Peptococcaceae bacterium]
MFTGLAEELGTIKAVDSGQASAQLKVAASIVLNEVRVGDSIAVNGVCLTVVKFTDNGFTAQVMEETLRKTNLKELKAGDKVNLERALRVGERLGGHIVSGHIDGIGQIMEKARHDIAIVLKIAAAADILENMIPKGSISIDGISLTIVEVNDDYFTVSLIPHTMLQTTLGIKQKGAIVNLETDVLGKYVRRFLDNNNRTKNIRDVSVSFLAENGFL